MGVSETRLSLVPSRGKDSKEELLRMEIADALEYLRPLLPRNRHYELTFLARTDHPKSNILVTTDEVPRIKAALDGEGFE